MLDQGDGSIALFESLRLQVKGWDGDSLLYGLLDEQTKPCTGFGSRRIRLAVGRVAEFKHV